MKKKKKRRQRKGEEDRHVSRSFSFLGIPDQSFPSSLVHVLKPQEKVKSVRTSTPSRIQEVSAEGNFPLKKVHFFFTIYSGELYRQAFDACSWKRTRRAARPLGIEGKAKPNLALSALLPRPPPGAFALQEKTERRRMDSRIGERDKASRRRVRLCFSYIQQGTWSDLLL